MTFELMIDINILLFISYQRQLTKPREKVSPATVYWSNLVVEIAVVRQQAAPTLWLIVVSVMQPSVPPWVVH